MKCEICGKEIGRSLYLDYILCSSACFNKLFWKKKIENKDEYIVIDGVCYHDGGNVDSPENTWFLGHGGRRFWIRFRDGRTLTTNNLWCQGVIPEEFRDELPDTAAFYIPEHIKYANRIKQDIHGKGRSA